MAGAVVQSPAHVADDSGSNATTIAVTITGVTAGNTLMAAVGWSDGAGTITCSVSDGSAYSTGDSKRRNTTDVQSGQVFYLHNAGAGSHTVTATFSSTTAYRRIRVIEVSGLNNAAPEANTGQQNTGVGTGANAVTSGASAATSSANCFVVGVTQNTTENSPGTGTLTAGTGYTAVANSNVILGFEYKSVTATGAQTATFTQSVNNNRVTHVMAFAESGGGGAVKRNNLMLCGVGR